MPPRHRPAPTDSYHPNFDPGVTGCRTGIAPPENVRRGSDGFERFSDFAPSPNKKLSPIKISPLKQLKRARPQPRPDKHHEIGERGRKTGVSPPTNVRRGSDGFEDFGAYLAKATEMTNKDIEKERKKQAVVSRNLRKMSVATFVDDGEDDEDYREESMSLANSGLESHTIERSERLRKKDSNDRLKDRRRESAIESADDSSPIRTAHDSELANFDQAPGDEDRSNKSDKGKQKAAEQEPEDHESDSSDSGGGGGLDYDQGPAPDEEAQNQNDTQVLEDIPEEDEEGESEETRLELKEVDQPAKRKKKNPRANPPPPAGVRRSDRQRLPRLAHWRGEHVVYGRSQTPVGNLTVVGMVDVVRVPDDPVEPFATRNRRGTTRRIKSESVPPDGPPNVSADVDARTTPIGVVFSHTKQIEVRRRLVSTRRNQEERLKNEPSSSKDRFQFQRLFTESDFSASGILYIPVGQAKPTKASKDNCYDFTVLRGHVSVTVHRTNFVVGPEGLVHVPRGNLYSLENVGDCVAKVSFSQSRRIAVGSDPDEESDTNEEPLVEGEQGARAGEGE
ncbi:hypothetical protein CROQUDRAFT_56086 [Cronartium quercuum f. sp. fusiforme G11]|uniref:Mif2/CENP-C cupin domain-containing protein n=1 Tax=Cronartium quercuum f. sp. fusiforme G11 TaxID=708437 RepID=A0A9P6NXT0_9BASI|nr:hypothetical protein CROQUDRAFT_56086 [Cronartium quercuum f. sp. fusiforme G11]